MSELSQPEKNPERIVDQGPTLRELLVPGGLVGRIVGNQTEHINRVDAAVAVTTVLAQVVMYVAPLYALYEVVKYSIS